MADKPKIAEELAKQDEAYEPILPIEKKLIAWSFILGVGGLGLLIWISYTYFPAGH